ncbi:phage holin family protein [Acidovorax soli]|uniref:phage holin family protein n=1 Tax=Acidovorax soli TaxID=592050 RepID=UPI0032B21762
MGKQEPGVGNAPTGLMDALRRLLDHVLELLQLRLSLLGTELEAEKLRLFGALLGALLALLFGGMALGLLSLAIVLLSPDAWRWLAALLLGALYLGLAWWLWTRARERLAAPSGLFAASLAELGRDREELGGGPN